MPKNLEVRFQEEVRKLAIAQKKFGCSIIFLSPYPNPKLNELEVVAK